MKSPWLPILIGQFLPLIHGQQLENPYLSPELGRGLGTVNDQFSNANTQQQQQQRSRYPDRSQSYSDPAAVFRNPNYQTDIGTTPRPQQPSFQYEPYPTNNNSRSNVIVTRRTTTTLSTTTTQRTTVRPGAKPSRSPFDDPNRYRIPQAREQSDQVRFVNGRPYK